MSPGARSRSDGSPARTSEGSRGHTGDNPGTLISGQKVRSLSSCRAGVYSIVSVARSCVVSRLLHTLFVRMYGGNISIACFPPSDSTRNPQSEHELARIQQVRDLANPVLTFPVGPGGFGSWEACRRLDAMKRIWQAVSVACLPGNSHSTTMHAALCARNVNKHSF